jgi:parallel beta-helix repeat protein
MRAQPEHPARSTISQNTLQDNRFFGIVIQDGDGATSQNTISGGQVGIGVVAGARDPMLRHHRNRHRQGGLIETAFTGPPTRPSPTRQARTIAAWEGDTTP